LLRLQLVAAGGESKVGKVGARIRANRDNIRSTDATFDTTFHDVGIRRALRQFTPT
jgi:hypothetical protein